MENMNYSAPQNKEPASCGQRKKCIFCGAEFWRPGNQGVYCSLECRSQHRHLKTMEVRLCSECGLLFFVKKTSPARFCSRDCSMVTFHSRREKARHYRGKEIQGRKQTSRNGFIKSRSSSFGKARHRECENLRKWFGTAEVPESVRRANALRYIGSRISGGRPVRQIDKSVIKTIINRIEKGETYAAYE